MTSGPRQQWPTPVWSHPQNCALQSISQPSAQALPTPPLNICLLNTTEIQGDTSRQYLTWESQIRLWKQAQEHLSRELWGPGCSEKRALRLHMDMLSWFLELLSSWGGEQPEQAQSKVFWKTGSIARKPAQWATGIYTFLFLNHSYMLCPPSCMCNIIGI